MACMISLQSIFLKLPLNKDYWCQLFMCYLARVHVFTRLFVCWFVCFFKEAIRVQKLDKMYPDPDNIGFYLLQRRISTWKMCGGRALRSTGGSSGVLVLSFRSQT